MQHLCCTDTIQVQDNMSVLAKRSIQDEYVDRYIRKKSLT